MDPSNFWGILARQWVELNYRHRGYESLVLPLNYTAKVDADLLGTLSEEGGVSLLYPSKHLAGVQRRIEDSNLWWFYPHKLSKFAP